VNAVEVAAVHAQALNVGARGEQRRVELDLLLRGQRGDPLGGVELHHARPLNVVDPLLLPPLVRAKQRVLARLLALEVALRQRRPVVGRVRLTTHQQDRALPTLLAQPARAVGGRQPTADDQVVDLAARHG
jgi:hypothetical protein